MIPKAPVYAKRIVKAPIERVFQAWTNPEELKLWHAPEPEGIVSVVSENHVNGKRSLTLTIEGKTYQVAGKYKEFDPPYRLVYNWEDPAAPNNSIMTVLFKKVSDDTTELEVSYTNPTVSTIQQGLDMIIEHLQSYLTA